MNNLCITNYAMIFMFIIIILLVIKQKNISKNKEKFALGSDDLTIVSNVINRIYGTDIDAIRNLGHVSKSLMGGTSSFTSSTTGNPGILTIPADSIVLNGSITFDNSTYEKTYNSNDKGHSVGYIVSDNANYKKLMIVGNNTAGNNKTGYNIAGGVRSVGIWDELQVHGNEVVSGNLQIDGNVTIKGKLTNYQTNSIGVGQTWKKKTDKVPYGFYINTSGRPIQVCVSITYKSSSDFIFWIDGKVMSDQSTVKSTGPHWFSGPTDYGERTIGFDIIVQNGARYGISDVYRPIGDQRGAYNSKNYTTVKPEDYIWYELS